MEITQDFVKWCKSFGWDLINEKGLLKTLESYTRPENMQNGLGDHYYMKTANSFIDFNVINQGNFFAQAYGEIVRFVVDKENIVKTDRLYQVWINSKTHTKNGKSFNKIFVQCTDEKRREELVFNGTYNMILGKAQAAKIVEDGKSYVAKYSTRTAKMPLGLTKFKEDHGQINDELY